MYHRDFVLTKLRTNCIENYMRNANRYEIYTRITHICIQHNLTNYMNMEEKDYMVKLTTFQYTITAKLTAAYLKWCLEASSSNRLLLVPCIHYPLFWSPARLSIDFTASKRRAGMIFILNIPNTPTYSGHFLQTPILGCDHSRINHFMNKNYF